MTKSILLRVAYTLAVVVVFAVVPLFIVVPLIAIFVPDKVQRVLRDNNLWSPNLQRVISSRLRR